MEKQYCKVGSSTSLTTGRNSIVMLENLYQNFIQKASQVQNTNVKLGTFFELKAKKIQKTLEGLL